MSRAALPSLVTAAALWANATMTIAGPPANDGPPDAVIEWPAGIACDFGLRIEIRGAGHLTIKEFFDRNGNFVRFLIAGQNSALSFINAETGASVSFRPQGVVQQIRPNPDGTTTVISTGHVGITFFSTDIPPGPSTVMYVGRLETLVDSSGTVTTLVSFNGRKTDICAAVSP